MSEKLDIMLKDAGISFKGPYRPWHVAKILGVSARTLSDMVTKYEKDECGNLRNPATLESFMLYRERRITYQALETFLERNDTYERQNASPEIQLEFNF